MKCFLLFAITVCFFILIGSGMSSFYFLFSFLRIEKATCVIQSQMISHDKGVIKLVFRDTLTSWVEVCDELHSYRTLWDCMQEEYPIYKNVTCYANEKVITLTPPTLFSIHEVMFVISLASVITLSFLYFLYKAKD